MAGKNSEKQRPLAQNKKARHDYNILETVEAGIVLTGTEIKSVREGRVTLKDGFAQIKNDEAWLENVHISEYTAGNRFNHDPLRRRKLLLHKKQIVQLGQKTSAKGVTLVPLFDGNFWFAWSCNGCTSCSAYVYERCRWSCCGAFCGR